MFRSEQIKQILEDHDGLEQQFKKMLKDTNRIRKGYVFEHVWLEETGVTCWMHEQMAYSEDEYDVHFTWEEIDNYVKQQEMWKSL